MTLPARTAAQQIWLSSVTELTDDRLPALSIASTENVFDCKDVGAALAAGFSQPTSR